ncbi:MAG TPA: S9 family peptidase, partial [Acidobacteria bacterium]|nr:S9 family peptidase [Acidobacteriota bacterium]
MPWSWRKWMSLAWLVALASTPAILAGAAEGGARRSSPRPGQWLVAGPLPAPVAQNPAALAPEVQTLAEIDPARAWPVADRPLARTPEPGVSWRAVRAEPALSLEQPGVYWIASRLQLSRWAEVTIEVHGTAGLTIYADGEEIGTRSAQSTPATLEASVAHGRGQISLLVRAEVGPEAAVPESLTLSASAEPATGITWSADEQQPLFDLARRGEVARYTSLAVSTDGGLIARTLSRHPPGSAEPQETLEVIDPRGSLLASGVAGPGARALTFSPTEDLLLLDRRTDQGTDLLTWKAPRGPLRRVLAAEKGLVSARFDPSGRMLLLISAAGTQATESDARAAQRRPAPREKLPDFRTAPHLHLLDLATGSRRRLTLPGDFVLDDACFADSRHVVYARTLPRTEQPWFHTEVREIDIQTGEDRLLRDFVAGWEFRPRSLTAEPGGRHVAFIGPPVELGPRQRAVNVYDGQIWVLDRRTGSLERITDQREESYGGRGSALSWTGEGRLVASAAIGPRHRWVRLEHGADGWEVLPLPAEGEALARAAISPTGRFLASVFSSPTHPEALFVSSLESGTSEVVERPSATVVERWILSSPRDASFRGPGGERIDAWYYPPLFAFEPRRIPLVVYTYGGAVPTTRAFNPMHQFLATHGYGVLVVNPRGAFGRGRAFADHHAGDWGPKAAADVLAAIDALLATHEEINPATIGLYGGSYGGFMTEYLLTISDRFAAAVSLYGISNIASYWGQGAWGWTYGEMASGGKMPWGDPALFTEHSPLFRAEKIHTPLLLLHGTSDRNVPPTESEQLFTALKILDRPVELVLFPGEDHGISGSFERRSEHRTMILEWFDRYLRDQGEA